MIKKKISVILIVLYIFTFLNYGQYKAEASNISQNKNIIKTNSKDVKQEINFAPYMKELQRKIKKNWVPPKGNESKRVVVLFSLARDGRLLQIKIQNSSGIREVDDAAIKAVKLSSPFNALPAEFKGNKVDINFTFDYKVEFSPNSNLNYKNKFNNDIQTLAKSLLQGDTDKFKDIIQKVNFNLVDDIIYKETGVGLLESSLLVPEPKAEIVDLIIKAGANVNFVSKEDGLTSLQTITMRKDIKDPFDIVNLLIKAGADVNAFDDEGKAPIVITVMYGQINSFKLLMQSGANLNLERYSLLDIAEYQKRKTQDTKYDEIIEILKKTNKISPLNIVNGTVVLPKESNPTKTDIFPFSTYGFKYIYTLNIKKPVKNLEFKVSLPYNIKEIQYISDLTITPKPNRIQKGHFYTQMDGINAKYVIPYLDKDFKIIFEGKVKTRTYNIKAAKKMNQNISPETRKTLQKYLRSEKNIESNDEYIKNIADKIQGNTQEEIVENIYKYTQNKIKYNLAASVGAKAALKRGYGKCMDYARVMTAIARAKSIPARIALGKMLNNSDDSTSLHAWVEIYYDKYGWVTYDPTIEPVTKDFYDVKGNITRTDTIYSVSRNKKYLKTGVPFEVIPFDKSSINVDVKAYGKRY